MAEAGKALAIIGGLLILAQGLAAGLAISTPSIGFWVLGASMMSFIVAIVFGVLVLVGGLMSGSNAQKGAILALVFSIIALGFGGGWIIGSVLGIIGGAMLWKK